jgi:hypothetical protein
MISVLNVPPENDAYLHTEPLEFIEDLYDIIVDGDNMKPEDLLKDMVYMLKRYLDAHPIFRQHSELGETMTYDEFVERVKKVLFVNYDGFGIMCNDTQESNRYIMPSDLFNKDYRKPSWVTHVHWFNK